MVYVDVHALSIHYFESKILHKDSDIKYRILVRIFIEIRNSKCGTIETLAAQISGRFLPSCSISRSMFS